MDRRSFLIGAAGTFAASAAANRQSGVDIRAHSRIRAVAFDGFPVIDPRPIAMQAEKIVPGRGEALMAGWRTRQFEYTWLRTLSGHYVDFWRTTQDALVYAAESLGVSLPAGAREQLMAAYLTLRAWPDALPALQALRSAGIRMAFLSNFTEQMLDAAINNSGLQGFFEPHLSTDRVRAYKPHPDAYAMALAAFGLPREEILFCASAGWDAAGAKWFGYPTYWVNRLGQPAEELGVRPDGAGAGMADLAGFILN